MKVAVSGGGRRWQSVAVAGGGSIASTKLYRPPSCKKKQVCSLNQPFNNMGSKGNK